MSEVKITLFTDRKLTNGNKAALLEFSTGENKVEIPRYDSDLGYYISLAIKEVIKSHSENKVFEKLS